MFDNMSLSLKMSLKNTSAKTQLARSFKNISVTETDIESFIN